MNSVSNYCFVLLILKTLSFQCLQRAAVKIVLQNAVFCGVSKIFCRSWDILQNFSKIVEKHIWKNLCLVKFGMYAIEGLFKCILVGNIFQVPLSRILLKVSEHLFPLHLLVVAFIFQDCFNVDDTIMQVKKYTRMITSM